MTSVFCSVLPKLMPVLFLCFEIVLNVKVRSTSHVKFVFVYFLPAEFIREFRRDDSTISHLVSSPSFARERRLANNGLDTRWPTIDFVDFNVCLKMILHISLAWFGQPSTETVKQLPSFQIDFGGKIKW